MNDHCVLSYFLWNGHSFLLNTFFLQLSIFLAALVITRLVFRHVLQQTLFDNFFTIFGPCREEEPDSWRFVVSPHASTPRRGRLTITRYNRLPVPDQVRVMKLLIQHVVKSDFWAPTSGSSPCWWCADSIQVVLRLLPV